MPQTKTHEKFGFITHTRTPPLEQAREGVIYALADRFNFTPEYIRDFFDHVHSTQLSNLSTWLEGKIGIEAEFFTDTAVSEVVGDEGVEITDGSGTRLGTIVGEANRYQAEVNLAPASAVDEVVDNLHRMAGCLPFPLYALGERSPQDIGATEWVRKGARGARYSALREAVKIESFYGEKIEKIIDAAALHIHFDVDPGEELGCELLNTFTKVAPVLENIFSSAYCVSRPHRSFRRWCGSGTPWADPYRLPGYRLFGSPKELVQKIARIPRLIKKVGDGEYEPDLTRLDASDAMKDPLHLGTIWWYARVTPASRLEVRCFPSLPVAPEADVDDGVSVATKTALFIAVHQDEIPHINRQEWSKEFHGRM